MELRSYAEQILFGASLADKLVTLDGIQDERRGDGLVVPIAPTRPQALAFGRGRADFPSTLNDEAERGRALHFFANHELLAMELMALVLLRFPEAPPRFRRQLASTIADEQRHLRLYLDRMATLGVDVGEVPVNDFFWRAVKDVPTPLDFVARMSLGFEQANLDFSRSYARRLRELGDEVTAALLDEVYEDEIRHVRHGVRWFDEWREDGDAFEVHAALLAPPLGPMRMKGPELDVEGRRRAGFPPAYIEALRLYRTSKGRPPRVFVFNATAEEERARGRRYTAPANARALEADLAFSMAFLAKAEDVVVAPRPSRSVLRALVDAGFEIPECVDEVAALAGRDVQQVVPWGESPRVDRWREALGLSARAAPDHFDKVLGVEIARAFGDEGADVARSVDEAIAAITKIAPRDTLIKARYAASGRHRRRFGVLDEPGRRWLAKRIEEDGAVVVEPWCRRVRDFGAVLRVGAKDPLLDVFELLVDERGAYRGHRLRARHRDLDRSIRAGFFEHVRAVAEHVAEALERAGYTGPAGVDLFVHEVDGEQRWRSIVDVNARYTMGHVARALKPRVAPKTDAVWWHGPPSFIADVVERYPVRMRAGRIEGGVLATTDPGSARLVAAALFVGDGVDALELAP